MIAMRLIDADKFVLSLMDASLSSVDEDTILDLIDGIDTVDAVPVVRCEDCLFWEFGENECESWEWCKMLNTDMSPHAFCYFGEPKGAQIDAEEG